VAGQLRAPASVSPARDAAWPSRVFCFSKFRPPPGLTVNPQAGENAPFFHLPTPRAFLAMTAYVALKRIKKL